MPSKLNITGVLLSMFFIVSFSNPSDSWQDFFPPGSGWKFRYKKDSIAIYSRTIKTEAGQTVRLVKGAMRLGITMKQLLPAFTKEEFAGQWIPRKKKYYRIVSDTDNSWLAYTQLALPWPFRNMDLAVTSTLKHSGKKKIVINLKCASGVVPETKGIKRMKDFAGAWTLVALNPGQTLVTYELFSTHPPEFPRWVADPIVNRNLWQHMNMLRDFTRQNRPAIKTAAVDGMAAFNWQDGP